MGSRTPICVDWKIASDEALKGVVSSGQAFTSSDIDYTVKVEAAGLAPFTQYWYQFSVCGSNNHSPLGRTKTAPNADDDVTSVSVAVYSCSNYPFGEYLPIIVRTFAHTEQDSSMRTATQQERIQLTMPFISETTSTNTQMVTMAGAIPLVESPYQTVKSTPSTTTARESQHTAQIWIS